jgi:hypothetical protein
MMEPQVSVVLPVFGDHRSARVLPLVCRAWLAQDVPVEIVIGVGYGTPAPPAVDDDRVRMVFAGPGPTATGRLRNLAVAATRAPSLYLSDADVVPLGSGFLTRALQVADGEVLIQPWMYRLVDRADPPDPLTMQSPGRGRACYVYAEDDGRLVPVGNESFDRGGGAHMFVTPPPEAFMDVDTGWQPTPYHWGGALVGRKLFDSVGGYHTAYEGWGCEDDDLIAKLHGRARVLRGWRVARELTCVHYEHTRSHTAVTFPSNQVMLNARLAAGAEVMIAEDLA